MLCPWLLAVALGVITADKLQPLAERIQALDNVYEPQRRALVQQYYAAADEAARQAAYAALGKLQADFAQRYLGLARQQPKSQAATMALQPVMMMGTNRPAQAEAVRLFHTHQPVTAPGAGRVAVTQVFGAGETETKLEFCRDVLQQNPSPQERGLALFAQAHLQQIETRYATERQVRTTARVEAIRLFEQVLREYAQVPMHEGATLGQQATPLLAGLKNQPALAPGQPALALEGRDLDGKPLTLADYRGQVVLLSFWAHWCGVCMHHVPEEQKLVAEFAGRPFVLLGVNGDDVVGPIRAEQVQARTQKAGITWRSFQNARPGRATTIADEWAVLTWPTYILIDQRGVIRHYLQDAPGTAAFRAALDALVKEAEAARRK